MRHYGLLLLGFVLLLSSCATRHRCKNYHDCLADGVWVLQETTSKGVRIVPSEGEVTLQFSTSDFFGCTGCNRFFGSYSMEREGIVMELKGATKMMCHDMTVEDAMLPGLEEVTLCECQGERLRLSAADGDPSFVFVKQ